MRAVRRRIAVAVTALLLVATLAVGFAPAPASAQEDVVFTVGIRSCPSAAYPAAIGTFAAANCLREPTFNLSRSYEFAFDDGESVYAYDIVAGEGVFAVTLPAAIYTLIVSDEVSGTSVSTIVTFLADGSGSTTFTEYYALGSLPAANDDAYSVDEGQTLTVPAPGVLGNDQYLIGGETVTIIEGPNEGSATLNANGSLSYTPNQFQIGDDIIEYQLLNASGVRVSTATVTITVNAVNDAPVANPDFYATDEDTPLLIADAPLANDSDAEGSALLLSIVDVPTNGTLTLDLNGDFTYRPNANFNGTDSFTYRARDDADALSALATVTITVNAVNDAPVANPDSYTATEDTPLVVAAPGVLANDSDAEGTPLLAVLLNDVSQGALTLNDDGSFSYVPRANFFGTDSFRYGARENQSQGLSSNSVTVTITVNAVNDLPTIADRADIPAEATGPTGATVTYTLPVASDSEDGPLTPICLPASRPPAARSRSARRPSPVRPPTPTRPVSRRSSPSRWLTHLPRSSRYRPTSPSRRPVLAELW